MTATVRAPAPTAGVWTVSDSRTQVAFAVRNLGRPVHGSVTCRWGELETDGTGAPVRVVGELDLGTVDTGIAKRDADLRKPWLLDIERHPTMTWGADRFTRHDDGRWTAEGVLHVRGTSAPLAVTGVAEVLPDGWVRVRATAALDRRSVGIRAPRFLIGSTVEIDVDAWLSCPCPG
ncbi:YceI family protein [Blastococcus haudaquaticus]|uniref:Polyisoprenoid-binding protein YceI n=1 Tax=Blastococcus haudaquaticus TaxID=1938745 RepID=A0A286GU42_9ACTN|nr:YceI family protein [Blastococcus haudaquaticus]SOD99075.1 Polyisoprenoid-binding protein YceI [Blastococcus haudaquaticus]